MDELDGFLGVSQPIAAAFAEEIVCIPQQLKALGSQPRCSRGHRMLLGISPEFVSPCWF